MSVGTAGNKTVKDVQLMYPSRLVVIDANDPRFDVPGEDKIADLVTSMNRNGQEQDIIVWENDDQQTEVIDGRCRLRAALEITKTQPEFRVRVRTVSGITKEQAYQMATDANLIRAEATMMDRAKSMNTFLTVYGWEKSRVADYFKVTETSVNQMVKMLTADHELQQAVVSGALHATTAINAADLSVEVQKNVAQVAVKGKNAADKKAAAATAAIKVTPVVDLGADAKAKEAAELKAKKKADAEARKIARDLKRDQAQAKKEANRIAAEAKRQARLAGGAPTGRGVADVKRLFKDGGRVGTLPTAILAYFDGDIEDNDFLEIIDTAQDALTHLAGVGAETDGEDAA